MMEGHIDMVIVRPWNQLHDHWNLTPRSALNLLVTAEASQWPAIAYRLSGFGLTGEFTPGQAERELLRLQSRKEQSIKRKRWGTYPISKHFKLMQE